MDSQYNFLFLSDLHLSEGFYPSTNKLSRNEDFFHDEAFARFLLYHINLSQNHADKRFFRRPWKLVINGDIFDFLQVTSKPLSSAEYSQAVGDRALTENEKKFGLGTSGRATVWKLGQVKKGHPLFFQALGWFLAHEGNEVVMLKGNHDVELFWPPVQTRLRQLVVEAYREWVEGANGGTQPDSPLPLREYLPAALDPEDVAERLRFPAWFYYEPGLFYVEHGNQYDPSNAFDDFLEPILEMDREKPAEDQRIALPFGSFFVRYFFNKVEDVHPFADNIKPLMRYVRYALLKEPVATARLLTTHYDVLPQLWKQLAGKQVENWQEQAREHFVPPVAEDPGAYEVPLEPARWQALYRIRAEHQGQVQRDSRKLSRGTAATVALNGGVAYFLARALRHFVERKYGAMARSLLAAVTSFVGSTVLSGELDKLDEYVDLGGAAEKICGELNRPGEDGQAASVRFLIFGHDHLATVKELHDDGGQRPPFRQWYVNTGSWLPTFDESNRLLRGDVQFTFLRIIPGLDDSRPPQLLEWRPQMNSVRPIQLFGAEPPATPEEEEEEGFKPTVEGLPDVAP